MTYCQNFTLGHIRRNINIRAESYNPKLTSSSNILFCLLKYFEIFGSHSHVKIANDSKGWGDLNFQ